MLQLAVKVSYLKRLLWETEPVETLKAENTPGHARMPAPIIIAQGDADPLVRPAINAAFATRLCGDVDRVDYRSFPGVMDVDADPKSAADVAVSFAKRFACAPAPSTRTGV